MRWEKRKNLKENCQMCETSQCDTKSFIQIIAQHVWKDFICQIFDAILFTSFDNRDIFKFSIWTTLAGHHLGYEEYMRKNFLVTITFPLLVNVANVYFFFKVIMPTRYLWFNMPSKSSNNFHFTGVGHIWEAGFWWQKSTPFFLKITQLFLKMTPIFFHMNRIWPASSNRCGDSWAALTKREKWLGLESTEGTWLHFGKIPFICCLGGSVPPTSVS